VWVWDDAWLPGIIAQLAADYPGRAGTIAVTPSVHVGVTVIDERFSDSGRHSTVMRYDRPTLDQI